MPFTSGIYHTNTNICAFWGPNDEEHCWICQAPTPARKRDYFYCRNKNTGMTDMYIICPDLCRKELETSIKQRGIDNGHPYNIVEVKKNTIEISV